METRALLAFLISVAILVGYQMLFAPTPREEAVGSAQHEQPPARVIQPEETPAGKVAPAAVPTVIEVPRPRDETIVKLETRLYRASFTSFGGRLSSFELSDFRVSASADSPALDMVASETLLPLGVYWTGAGGEVAADTRVTYEIRADSSRLLEEGRSATITMVGSTPEGVRIEKQLILASDSYVIDYTVRVTGESIGAVGVAWARGIPEQTKGRFAGVDGPVVFADGVLHSYDASKLKEPVVLEGETSWGGYADHYFLAAYYSESPTPLRFVGAAGGRVGEVVLWNDGVAGEIAYRLFIGPKKIHLLGSLGHDLDEAMNLGWFTFVARPLLELMIFLHRFVGNYGWAIVLITVGIRLVFYPINKRQIEAMKAMQRVQPELKRIQEKYKDDRERLNKEMIEVYRRHKVNPLSGCLPMVLQLPVFLGLYNALMQSIELRHAPFVGWIHDLSAPDRLGSLAIPFVSPPGIPVMTLLMGASMVIQQRMTPTSADPVQQRMMMFLPVVFTIMFINFPSGLVLYWFANNVLSIVQQHIMTRGKS